MPAVTLSQPRRWVVALVSGGFFVLLAYILVQHVRVHLNDILPVGIVALAFLYAVLTADRILARNDWLRRHQGLALGVGFLLVFAVQLVFVRELYGTVGWDPRAVFAAAIELSGFRQSALAAQGPETYMVGFVTKYWGAYPNNLLLVFTYETIFRLCTAFGIPGGVFLSTALNVLVVDLAIVLAALSASRLWGRSAGRTTLLIAVPFLGFSPWITLAYSDTLATVFPVLLLYLYLRYVGAAHRRKYVYAAAIGAVSALGYLVKPHVLAMTLAIGLIHGLSRGDSESTPLSRLLKLATFALAALVVMSGFTAYRDYRLRDRLPREQMEALRFPVSHFIAMSLNNEYGGYNGTDVDAQRALPDVASRNERNIRVIKERLNQLGLSGYAAFVHRKLTWMTTDGTLFWQVEGRPTDYVPFHDGTHAKWLQSVFYRDGARHRWFNLAAEGVWLALLFSMLAPVATRERSASDAALLMVRLSIVVLLLMLLVLEGRSRYLISFVPVFVLLGSYYLSGRGPLGRWSILQPVASRDRS